MNVLVWAISLVFLWIFIGIAMTNAITIIRYYSRGQTGSLMPFFGWVSGVIGIAIMPIDGSWKFAWLPVFLDFWLVPAIYSAIKRLLSKSNGEKK